MASKSYKKGVSALYSELNDCMITIGLQDPDCDHDNIYALAEFIPNKFNKEFFDVKVKNIYTLDGDKHIRLEDFKSFTVYQCLQLKKSREYAAIAYDGKRISIDEAVTNKIARSTRNGRYGTFDTLYIPENFTDFECL